MATTSDERREVAARLREAATDDDGKRGFQVTLWRIIGTSNPSRWTLYARLADLIDPEEEDTCCDVSDDGDFFTCSRCGCSVRLRSAESDAFENVNLRANSHDAKWPRRKALILPALPRPRHERGR